jgi:hypothetical protein
MDDEFLLSGMAAAPVIVALVAATGQAWRGLPRSAYPLLSIAYGVAWHMALATRGGGDIATAALAGVVVGLAASGLYSAAVKPTYERRAAHE